MTVAGSFRRSFSTDGFNWMSNRGMIGQTFLHLVKRNGVLVMSLGGNGQVMEIFQKLLVFADWQNNGLFFATLAGYEFGMFGPHRVSPVFSEVMTLLALLIKK
jgi:hypothetical protein